MIQADADVEGQDMSAPDLTDAQALAFAKQAIDARYGPGANGTPTSTERAMMRIAYAAGQAAASVPRECCCKVLRKQLTTNSGTWHICEQCSNGYFLPYAAHINDAPPIQTVTNNALTVVHKQAEDRGLWFIPETITEDYLQRALRKLHAAVEGDAASVPRECCCKVLRKQLTTNSGTWHICEQCSNGYFLPYAAPAVAQEAAQDQPDDDLLRRLDHLSGPGTLPFEAAARIRALEKRIDFHKSVLNVQTGFFNAAMDRAERAEAVVDAAKAYVVGRSNLEWRTLVAAIDALEKP